MLYIAANLIKGFVPRSKLLTAKEHLLSLQPYVFHEISEAVSTEKHFVCNFMWGLHGDIILLNFDFKRVFGI